MVGQHHAGLLNVGLPDFEQLCEVVARSND